MICTNVLGEHPFKYRVVVWHRMKWIIIHFLIFSKHPFRQVAFYSIYLFLKINLVLNLKCGMELNECPPPNSSDDL